MSIVNQDELKAIRVLKFTGKESEWDHWSEKFISLTRPRGFVGILLGTEQACRADKEIDRKKSEGEDKITLLSMFQQNQLVHVRTNITVWLTSMAIQENKLKKLNHVLDEAYQITHILASLPREYSSVVE